MTCVLILVVFERQPSVKMSDEEDFNYTLYFKFDNETNFTKCSIPDCKSNLKGWNTSNLKRHLRLMHYSIFVKLFPEKDNGSVVSSAKGVLVKTNEKVVEEGALEMVTINGLPFNVLNCSGFRRICDPLFKALCTSVHSDNVNALIAARAHQISNRIQCQVQGKLISVMMDFVKKYGRCILGISLQYFDHVKGNIQIFTISMHRMERRQTAENICEILSNILQKFKVDPLQVLSITTDNAKNMVNVSNYMNDIATAADDCFILDNSFTETENYDGDDFLCDEDYLESLIANAAQEFASKQPSVQYVNRVNCGVHTLQLAVKDVLHKPEIAAQINKYRNICKKLRNPLLSAELSKMPSKKALLDVETRWNSTFDMVRLIVK